MENLTNMLHFEIHCFSLFFTLFLKWFSSRLISPSDSHGVQRRDQSPCSAPVGGDSLLSRSVQQRAKKASLHASAASSEARPGLTSPSPGGHKARF